MYSEEEVDWEEAMGGLALPWWRARDFRAARGHDFLHVTGKLSNYLARSLYLFILPYLMRRVGGAEALSRRHPLLPSHSEALKI